MAKASDMLFLVCTLRRAGRKRLEQVRKQRGFVNLADELFAAPKFSGRICLRSYQENFFRNENAGGLLYLQLNEILTGSHIVAVS